jgi:hypothetical protein
VAVTGAKMPSWEEGASASESLRRMFLACFLLPLREISDRLWEFSCPRSSAHREISWHSFKASQLPLGSMAERQVSKEQRDRAQVSRRWWLEMQKGDESELDVHRAEDGSDISGGVCSTMTQARGPAGGSGILSARLLSG